MNLKEMLKGNVISIGKNYKDLTGEELKLLLSLKCLSNKNNYIVGINKSILINLFKLDKRTFDKHFNGLINKEFIKVDGDISKFASVEVIKDETFETFDVEFILNMLDDLTGAEVKLFSTLTSYLNENKNRNYIYPSIEDVAKRYYEGDLTEEDLKKKISNKGIDKIKNNLIEKGYIRKVAAYYFEKKDGTKGISKLGYFLKTDKNEVGDDEYFEFIKEEINKYNENHSNMMKLATEEYLKKCKYKNLDKYIYYVHQEDDTVKEENSKQVQAVEEVEPVVETEEVVVKEIEVVEETKPNETIQEEVVDKTLDPGVTIEETFKNIFELDYIKNKKLKWLKDSIEELISKANECGLNKNDYCKMLNDWIFSYKKLVEDLGVSAALNKMHRDIEVDCLNYKSQKHFDYNSISHEAMYEDYIVPEKKVTKKRKKGIFELLDVDKKAVEPETDEFVAEINSWFNN